MAQAKTEKNNSLKVKLVSNLALSEQDRSEESKGAYPGGRFKRFFDTFKANFQQLMLINLCAIIFALPIIAVIMVFKMIGIEKLGYLIAKEQTPYLMNSFGIGLSSGMPLTQAKDILLNSYRIMITAMAAGLPILAFGFAGNLGVMKKLVWGETLLMKKDRQGRDIPRLFTEFFRAVGKYWKETIIIMVFTMIVFAGVANLVLNFVQAVWRNQYTAGSIISLIAAIILIICYFPLFINLLPTTVTYNFEFKYKLKNASILTLTFYIPSLFILAISLLPFFLLAAGRIVSLIMFVFILAFGISFFSLAIINYNDYHHEKIIDPLFQARLKMEIKQQRRSRKKK